MGKYDPLYNYLYYHNESKIILSYDEIEKIITTKLPNSAYKYKQWWDNNSHVQSKAWRNAGYKVSDIVLGDKAIFEKE